MIQNNQNFQDLREPLLDVTNDINQENSESNFKLYDNTKQATSQSSLSFKQNSEWILYSVIGACLIAICNVAISEVSYVGLNGLLYLSPGALICAISFKLYTFTNSTITASYSINTHSNHYHTMNTLTISHIAQFVLFALIYFGSTSMIMISFYYCTLTNVNTGVLSTIWAITPLFSALLDYLMFQQKLLRHHLLGVICLILCAILISFSNIFNGNQTVQGEQTVGQWIPVVMAIVGAIFIALRGFHCKILVAQYKFDPVRLSYAAQGLTALPLFIILILQMQSDMFSIRLFIVGTLGSIIQTLAGVFIVKASSIGPLGPVNAIITCGASILFCTITFVSTMSLPTVWELTGLLVGIMGALILTIPEYLTKIYNLITIRY